MIITRYLQLEFGTILGVVKVGKMELEKDQEIHPDLIKSLKAGNPRAFKQVFLSYEKPVYYFVLSITKSEYISEEILQEVFIRLWSRRELLDPQQSFDGYLFTIARNLTYNYLRDASRRESVRDELWSNIQAQYQQVETDIIFEEYKEIVEDIIRNLPRQKRSIYQLSRQQGKSHSEIADMLGISPKTVKNHLWNTMSTIRHQLKPYLDDTLRVVIYIMFLWGLL